MLIFSFKTASTTSKRFKLLFSGYVYDSSVLDSSCGIEILEGQIFKPLFKMFINANQPTMAVIGLIRKTFSIKLFDLKV